MSNGQTRFTWVEKVLAVVGLLTFILYCYMSGMFFHYIRAPENIFGKGVPLEVKGITVFINTDEYIQQALCFWIFVACFVILAIIRLMRYWQKIE